MRRAMAWWIGWCLAGSALVSSAQGHRNEVPPTRAYMRQPAFVIPFQVDPRVESPIEVQLFVSQDAGRTWRLAAREQPRVERFSFKAPQDGMYWFTSRTIGRDGSQLDPNSLRPELLVVIDSRQPELDLQISSPGPRQVRASWTAFDPSLDAQSFQLEYRVATDAPWQPVSVDLPDARTETQTFSGQVDWSVPSLRAVIDIRAAVRDRAGNLTAVTRRLALVPPAPARSRLGQHPGTRTAPDAVPPPATGAPAATGPRAQPVSSSLQRASSDNVPHGQPLPASGQIWRPDNLPAPPSEPERVAARSTHEASSDTVGRSSFPSETPANTAGYGIPADPYAGRTNHASTPSATTVPRGRAASLAGRPELPAPVSEELPPPRRDQKPEHSGRAQPVSQPLPARTEAETSPANPALPGGERAVFTNSPRFKLDYDVESVGIGRVAEVQLWVTSDGGSHWTLWGKDADRQSPFDVEVDRDGVYGFRMVIVGDNGLATPRPAPGDGADIWVAVDTTRPVVQLTGARYGVGHQSGQLVITWEAHDAYLPSMPIALAYGASRQGPWNVIASDLPNSGEYAWRPGPATPRNVFLKIVVRDEAGNSAEAIHPDPVDLMGLAPRARIRGVSGTR